MNRDCLAYNKEVIRCFIDGEDFPDKPDHNNEHLKRSHDEKLIHDFINGKWEENLD